MDQRNRRRMLASALVAGSSFKVAGSWTRPVIESVLLPAHAQTTVIPDRDPPSNNPGDGPLAGPGFLCSTNRSTVPLGQEVLFQISPLDDASETIAVDVESICDGQIINLTSGSFTLPPGTNGGGTGITLPLDGSLCGIGSQLGLRITNTGTNETFDCQIPVTLTTTTISCFTDTDDGTASLDQLVAFRIIASSSGDGEVPVSLAEILNGNPIGPNAVNADLEPGELVGVGMGGRSARDRGFQAGDVFGIRATRGDNGETLDCTVRFVEDP